MELLICLYENLNQAVSYNDIKLIVWPERIIQGSEIIHNVDNDEINSLVYRLRKNSVYTVII